MDVVLMHDQGVGTETPNRKIKPEACLEQLEKFNTLRKSDKKKSDTKKLRKKLVEIEEKNETLSKVLSDKNSEINELKKSVNSLNEVLNSVPIEELRCNSSIASTKLLELSKKNRQLKAELEMTKNRLTKKDIQIQKLERELKLTGDKISHDTHKKEVSVDTVKANCN